MLKCLKVLISTYWNVNFDLVCSPTIVVCFNLNLLECKCVHVIAAAVSFPSFNLNLLECKFEDEINSMTDVQGF